MLRSEAQFRPERPQDIDEAYSAKEALDYAQKTIDEIKDEENRKKAQTLLDKFIELSPKYTEIVIATDKYKDIEELPLSEEYLKERIEQRRETHNQLIEILKKMTQLIIGSGVKNSEWQEYVEDNLLSRNPQKISWLAINMAKWKIIERELEKSKTKRVS